MVVSAAEVEISTQLLTLAFPAASPFISGSPCLGQTHKPLAKGRADLDEMTDDFLLAFEKSGNSYGFDFNHEIRMKQASDTNSRRCRLATSRC